MSAAIDHRKKPSPPFPPPVSCVDRLRPQQDATISLQPAAALPTTCYPGWNHAILLSHARFPDLMTFPQEFWVSQQK